MPLDLPDLLERMALLADDAGPSLRARIVTPETRPPDDPVLLARRGDRWCMAPRRHREGDMVWTGYTAHWVPAGLARLLTAPLSIAATHVLTVTGTAVHDGRRATRVHASPRDAVGHSTPPHLRPVDFPVDLDVDDETGLVLAVRDPAAGPDATPLLHLEALAVGAGVAGAELEPPEPPPTPPELRLPPVERRVSLDEAAAAMDFALFRPTLVPQDAAMRVITVEHAARRDVAIVLAPPHGHWTVRVRQQAAVAPRHVGIQEEPEMRHEGGLTYELWANGGNTWVGVEREGTYVMLSGAYPREEMLRVARSLVPVQAAPFTNP